MLYFPASSSEEARKHVSGVVRRGSGLALIIGGVGVGKTLLLERLRRDLHPCGNVHYLNAGRVRNTEELVQLGCFELGIKIDAATSSLQNLRLQLRSLGEKSSPIILLVDEADSLTLECLDELRAWSDMGLRCVLTGTSLLEETLTHPKLAAFNQRIAARCYLEPFLSNETKGFLRRDFTAAQLDDAAAALVHRLTEGVPRLLRQLLENFAHGGAIDCEEIQAMWNEIHALRSLDEWRNASASLENEEQFFESSYDAENVEKFDDDLTSDLAGAACLEVGAELAPRENVLEDFPLSSTACFEEVDHTKPRRTRRKKLVDPLRAFVPSCEAKKHQETAITEPVPHDTTFEIIDYGYELVAKQVAATPQEQEATPVTPAYVYQTNEPVVPQYPCYIDKNIAMMNWVAPGHRITSGFATSYAPATCDETHANENCEKSLLSESAHSPLTAAAPLTDSASHMKTSLQETFEEIIPVVQNTAQSIAQNIAQNIMREMPEAKVVAGSEKITTAAKTESAPREKLRIVEWNEIKFPTSDIRAPHFPALEKNEAELSENLPLAGNSVIERLVQVTHTLEQIVERLHGSHGVVERSLEKAVSSLGRRVEEIIDESLAPPIHELLEMFVDFEQQLQSDLQPFLSPINADNVAENPQPYPATKYDENLAARPTAPRVPRGVPVVRLFQDPPRRNFEVDFSLDTLFAAPRR